MTIKDAPFIGIAVPLEFSPISKAYWQTDAAVKDIAVRFSLKSNKATTKRAGPAKLIGVCCKHCSRELVVKNREHAISELKDVGSFRGIECSPCFRKHRDRQTMEMLRAAVQQPKAPRQRRSKKARNIEAPAASTKEEFYKSWQWRTLRMEVLKEHGRACQCCGAEPGMKDAAGDPVRICVDHIKPLSKFWHLRLDRKNLQVLCDECNQGKGNWDQTDFRPVAAPDEWIVEGDDVDQAILNQLSVHGETLQ